MTAILDLSMPVRQKCHIVRVSTLVVEPVDWGVGD